MKSPMERDWNLETQQELREPGTLEQPWVRKVILSIPLLLSRGVPSMGQAKEN